ncbi:MAG: hypothetical protein N2Z22_00885 [Turneriella sp.]|nr:hypothetical protein [Turneriella sp.]
METAWHYWENCIAICSKCAGKIGQMEQDKTRLRVALKEEIQRLMGENAVVRPVDISCLGICPEEKIAIAHFKPNGIETFLAEPDCMASQVLAYLGYQVLT